MKNIFQKSIVAASDIPKGTKLEFFHFAFKKPGEGISASEYQHILGKTSAIKINKNDLILENMLRR